MTSDKLNIGSLNVRGMNDMLKKKSIKKDLDQYDLKKKEKMYIKKESTNMNNAENHI